MFHIFAVRLERRDEFQKYLADNGVGTIIHYPVPPHKQDAMKGLFENSYPLTEKIHQEIISLPCSLMHTENNILEVCELANRFK